MATGITRLNGSTQAGSFYGYQPRWFEVAGTGFDTTPGAVDSNFEKAVRAIEGIATIVQLGYPGTGGFIVAVDGNTYDGYGSAGASSKDAVNAIDTVVVAATSIAVAVTEKTIGLAAFSGTGLVFATLAGSSTSS